MRARVAKAAAPSTPSAPAVVDLPAALRVLLAPLVGQTLLAGNYVSAGIMLALIALCDALTPRWAAICGFPGAHRRLDPMANILLFGVLVLAIGARLTAH